jgi:hypothetical protein
MSSDVTGLASIPFLAAQATSSAESGNLSVDQKDGRIVMNDRHAYLPD